MPGSPFHAISKDAQPRVAAPFDKHRSLRSRYLWVVHEGANKVLDGVGAWMMVRVKNDDDLGLDDAVDPAAAASRTGGSWPLQRCTSSYARCVFSI